MTNAEDHPPNTDRRRQFLAWLVHLFTASGAVCCLLALEAVHGERWQAALIWLVVAVAIDAVDGTLARLVQVKRVLPQFDGTLLDNLVDYLSYVFIPALILHRADLLPPDLSLILAAGICLASAYQFCQDDAKTPDHFFKGFPSYWNIAALYLLALQLSPQINAAIIGTLIALVFVPVKYIYVSRTQPFKFITWPLTIIWSIVICLILGQLPDPAPELVWGSLGYLAYYVGMSVYLTLKPQDPNSQPQPPST